MLPVGDRNKVGEREVEGVIKAVILNNRIEQKKNLSIIFGTMPWVTVRTIMIKFSRIIYVKLTLAKKEQKHISSHLLANMHIWYCNNRKQKINICMMFFLLLFFILLIMKLTLLRNQFKRKTTKKSTKALGLLLSPVSSCLETLIKYSLVYELLHHNRERTNKNQMPLLI